MMRYPIFIELGSDDSAFGMVLPDLPGCFSAGDTRDEALESVKEATALWIDATLDSGDPVPAPSSLETLRHDARYAGWILAVVELDPAPSIHK